MAFEENEIFNKIKSILIDQFNVSEDSIDYDTDFVEDLNADSLDIVDLFSTLSGEFDIDVDINLSSNFKTVGDVVSYIEDHS